MYKIVTDIEKLREPAEPFKFISQKGIEEADKKEINKVVTAIKDTLAAHTDLFTLSAPQIGVKKRVIGVKFNDSIKIFLNPVITKKENSKIIVETFYNLPNKEIVVARPDEITISYFTEEFKYEDNKLLGAAARLFDQQAQLLDGVIPSDIGLVSDITIDGPLSDLSEDEMKEVVKMYKQFIETKATILDQELTKDKELNTEYNKLKFTESVITGKAAIVEQPPKLNRAERRQLAKLNKKYPIKNKNNKEIK